MAVLLDRYDDLEHHGVKGQKWGVRRKVSEIRAHREATRRAGSSEDANRARDAEQKAKSSKQGTKALSNKELQDLVSRMNLERQLATLKEQQPSKFDQGHKVVKKALDVAATANKLAAFQKSPVGQAFTKELIAAIKEAQLAKSGL